MKRRLTITLECGYTTYWLNERSIPFKGNIIICARHRHQSKIVEIGNTYHVRCRGCRYSRNFGLGKLTALRAASAHNRKNPTHTVLTYFGEKIIERIAPKPYRLPTLPNF